MDLKFMNGNIADICADAVVLPSNMTLKEGKGCSEALFSKAGRKELKAACACYISEFGLLKVSDVVMTPAYKLDAEVILHACVPKWTNEEAQDYTKLLMTYTNALAVADGYGCRSIAFPLLASGHNGFDPELAFEVAVEAVKSYQVSNQLEAVYMILHGNRIVSLALEKGYPVFVLKKAPERKQDAKNKQEFSPEMLITLFLVGADMVKKFDKAHPECRKWATKAVLELIRKKYGIRL